MSTLDKMLALAASSHMGQFDKAGQPYFLHCMQVMYNLRTDDQELQQIAVGHDLLEDTGVNARGLKGYGFSERVIDGIVAMTKVSTDDCDTYMARVIGNPDAVRVKMADLEHNSDIRRLKGVTDKDLERTAKYMKFYEILKGSL
jgi:(p)ppGpp synthase/HD superfamily hydrolase